MHYDIVRRHPDGQFVGYHVCDDQERGHATREETAQQPGVVDCLRPCILCDFEDDHPGVRLAAGATL